VSRMRYLSNWVSAPRCLPDYIVDYMAQRSRPIKPGLRDRVVDDDAETEAEMLTVFSVAYLAGATSPAERSARRADARGSAIGANNLGVLLERRGDLDGAEAAYRRADQRGDGTGTNTLGFLLERRGDLAGAEAAYRRADERWNGRGTNNLGVVLEVDLPRFGGHGVVRRLGPLRLTCIRSC